MLAMLTWSNRYISHSLTFTWGELRATNKPIPVFADSGHVRQDARFLPRGNLFPLRKPFLWKSNKERRDTLSNLFYMMRLQHTHIITYIYAIREFASMILHRHTRPLWPLTVKDEEVKKKEKQVEFSDVVSWYGCCDDKCLWWLFTTWCCVG